VSASNGNSADKNQEDVAARRMVRMRQANAILSAVMLALFLFHGVGNAFELLLVGGPTSKYLARALLTLALVHAVLGVVLTVATVKVQRQAGTSYVRLNSRFWAVRASGVAIAVFIAFHMMTFLQVSDGPYRLREFGAFELATNVGLVLSMAVHVLTNVRPLAVSLGIGAPRSRAADLALVLSVLLLFMAVAFVVYFVYWSVV